MSRIDSGGLQLIGEGAFLREMIKAVLVRGLSAEQTTRLGYATAPGWSAGPSWNWSNACPGTPSWAFRDQLAARRGTNIAVVAAARRQLEYVYYALRDHHVHGVQPPPTVKTAPIAAAAS